MTLIAPRLVASLFFALVLSCSAGARDGLEAIGKIQPRHAKDIAGSPWMVGGETIDRGYSVYANWREHLGPLGAKAVRLQSGWARTEKTRGVYDWAWLDEIIPDVVAQGVRPVMCLGYGNTLYTGGGTEARFSPVPKGEGREAWLRFVKAFVTRYGKQIGEWEIWNEPDWKNTVAVADFAEFYLDTARAVRAVQPEAKLFFNTIDPGYAEKVLKQIAAAGGIGLVDAVACHPYDPVPEASYRAGGKVGRFQAIAAKYPGVGVIQGEAGAPSARGSFGALSNQDWTETKQAKWFLRRLLSDGARSVRSSAFTIVDLHYTETGSLRINSKGLLETNPNQTVKRPKLAYRAVQHLTAIFDQEVSLQPNASVQAEGLEAPEAHLFVRRVDGNEQPIVAVWSGAAFPTDEGAQAATVRVEGVEFKEPVHVDLLSGEISAIPGASIRREGGAVVFEGIPAGDWPVLIAEKSAIPGLK